MSKEVASVKQPICRVQIVLNFNYFWWCHSHIAKSNEAVGSRVLLEQAAVRRCLCTVTTKLGGGITTAFIHLKIQEGQRKTILFQ